MKKCINCEVLQEEVWDLQFENNQLKEAIDMSWKQDKDNFLKCSEPHENDEAGLKALDGFMDELAELRRKYKMRNLWLVGTYNVGNYIDDQVRVDELVFTGGWGEYMKSLDLYAYAFGVAYGDREKNLGKIIKAGENEGREIDADHVVGRTDGQ